MRIDILAFPGFDELDALGPLEVLRNAAKAGTDMDVALATIDGGAVTGSHAVTVEADRPFGDRAELLVVPGGGWNNQAHDGVRREVRTRVVPALLSAANRRGAIVAGVCTGAMLLAAADLTTGRHAITHHGAVEDLRASGALVIEARVVDDGDIITAGGVTSGLDLALWLVERFVGATLADGIATAMEYERRGTIWLRGRDPVPS